jgi:hypothetical protein
VLDGCGATLLQDVLAQTEPCADNVPLGAISIEVDEAVPYPSDDVRSPRRDLVV